MEAISVEAAPTDLPEEKITPPATPRITLSISDEDDDDDIAPIIIHKNTSGDGKITLRSENKKKSEMRILLDQLEREARLCMKKFFANKKFHCGGPLPQAQLFTSANIDLVTSLSVCQGITLAHEMVKKLKAPRSYKNDVPFEIDCVLASLDKVKSQGIPKSFQAGILLLYLKFCKGCTLPEIKIDVDISTIFEKEIDDLPEIKLDLLSPLEETDDE